MENEWLNLSEAADLLGVHPTTVRAWADRGELPTQRTPGGHRRFRRADVLVRMKATARPQNRGAELVMQTMMGRARLEITEGALTQFAWYQTLNQTDKKALREIGRRLLHLVVDYLQDDRQQQKYYQSARKIGQDYELLGHQNDLALSQTVKGYLYFRDFLSETIYDLTEVMGSQGTTDWGELHQQIMQLTNEVLVALIQAYEARRL